MPEKIRIIGAGPAGVSLTYFLRDTEYHPTIYEIAPRPGLKPCGWAVPRLIEKYLPVPEEHILNVIYGHRVFINGEIVFEEERSSPWGYIIDKPSWLKALLKDSGAKLVRKQCRPRDNSTLTVIAAGNTWEKAPKDKIKALSVKVTGIEWPYPGRVEIWFDTGFVGYYWVFPHNKIHVDVGVGGYKEYGELKHMLYSFIKKHPVLGKGVIGKNIRGAEIVASGLREDLLTPMKNTYVVGEAAGAVYPLSGEGIRPSVQTSHALYKALIGGSDYRESLRSAGIIFSMKVQKAVLEALKSMRPEERLSLMRSVPRKWVVSFGLGEFTPSSLLSLLLEGRGLFSKLISGLIVGKKAQ